MSQQFDAIYENGILRPLVPLAIPEQARVTITVNAQVNTGPASTLSRQNAALAALWADVDHLPQIENNDGWSVLQHDDLLYGGNE